MIGIVAPVIALEEYVEASGDTIAQLCLHPGGQGVHVARIIKEFGESCTLASLAGGELAPVLRVLLDQYQIPHRLVTTQAPTKVVLKLTTDYRDLAVRQMPAPKVNRHEADNLFEVASLLVMESKVVVLIGSLAEGMPSTFFARLVRLANRHGIPTVLDVAPEFLEPAVRAGPTVVKPGQHQLRELLGLRAGLTSCELAQAARQLCTWGAQTIVISQASDGAVAVGKDWAWELRPPAVEVVEQAGAGDSMVGVIAVGLAQGWAMDETLRTAVAAGAAKVLRHGLGTCKRDITLALRDKVQIATMHLPTARDACEKRSA